MPGKNSKHPRPRSSRSAPLLRQASPITPSHPLLDSLIQSHNAIVALVAQLSLQPRFEHASIPGYHRGRGGEWTKTKNKKRNRRKRKNKKKESDAAPGSHAPSSSKSSPPVPVPTSPEKKADHAQSMYTTLPASSSSSSSSMPHFINRVESEEHLGCCPNCQYIMVLSGLECCIECDCCSSLFALSDRCRCEHYESVGVDISDPNWESQIPTSIPRREVLGQKKPLKLRASSSSSSSSSMSLIPTSFPHREGLGQKRRSAPSSGATPSKKLHADPKKVPPDPTSISTPSLNSGGPTSTSISAPPQWPVLFSEPSNPLRDHGPDDPLVWNDF